MATNEPLGQMIIEMDISSVGFESSLKDMQKALKRNQQQMKAQMAVYDALEDNIGKLTANHDGLRDSMKLNEKQLDRLKQAYRDEVAASGESSEKAKQLAQQINRTVQEQAKYQAQLNRVTRQLEDAQDGTKELRDEISLLSSENRSIVANFRAQGKELEALEADYKGLGQAVNARNQLIDKEKQKLRRLKSQYGEQSEEYRRQAVRVRELETSNEQARVAMSRLQTEMQKAKKSTNLFSKTLHGAGDKVDRFSSRLNAFSGVAAGFGIAMGGMASAVSIEAENIENRLRTMANISEKQLKEIKKNIQETYNSGLTTELEETTNIAARTEQRGIKQGDRQKAIDYATVISKNSELEGKEIVDVLSMLQKKFGMTIEQAGDYAQRISQTGIEDFDQAMEYIPQLKDGGLSIDEIIARLEGGMKSGAWNSDKTLDLLAEGQKKIVGDGADAYKEFGLGAEYAKFQAGTIDYKTFIVEAKKKADKLPEKDKKAFWAAIFGTQGEDIDLGSIDGIFNANAKDGKAKEGQADDLVTKEKEKAITRLTAAYNQLKSELVPVGTAIMNVAAIMAEKAVPVIKDLIDWFKGLSDTQQNMIVGAGLLTVAIGPLVTALKIATIPFKIMWTVGKGVFNIVTKLASLLPSFSSVMSFLGKTADFVGKGFNLFGQAIGKVFNVARTLAPFLRAGLGAAFRFLTGPIGLVFTAVTLLISGFKLAYKHSETFRNFVNKLRDGLLNTWAKLKAMGVSGVVKLMWTKVKNFFVNGYNTVKAKMVALGTAIKNVWEAIKSKSSALVKSLWSAVKNFFVDGYNTVKTKMTAVKTSMTNIWDNIKRAVKDKVSDLIDNVKKMPGKMADGIAKGAAAMKKAGKTLLNGLIGGVEWGLNKVIKGANTVLKFFGSDKKIEPVDLKQYAKGTPDGGHTGGLAMVNDAPGSKYRELVQLPNGEAFIPRGRNVVMNLPQGTSVLRGDKTHEAIQTGMIPQYKTGIGFLDKAFDWGKEKFDKVKDWSSEIWDIATSPDAMKKVLAKFVNATLPENLTKGILPSAIGGLTNKMMDAAKDFLFSEKEAMEVAQGEFHWDGKLEKDPNKVGAGSGPQGLMSYVYQIFKENLLGKFKIKGFGGFSDRNMVGGSSKSMHAYGRAIDIFTASNQPDAEKKKIAEASRRLPLLQYAIYNKKWTKPGAGWSNYMRPGRNPHTDHVHIDFKAPTAANLKELGGAVGSTANVSGSAQAWAPQIKKAYRQMFGKSISSNELAAVIEQIHTESTGNAMAKQGIVDVNTFNGSGGSKGLLQFIQSTFDYYKVKGHGNIWSGYDQLLAMFNVPNWYTRITEKGPGRGWIPKGAPVKKYAQGGIIDKAHVGMVGEAGPEAIIPLSRDKRGRAMQLLAQAGQYMGMDSSTTQGSGSDNKVLALLAEQVNLLSQQVALLTGIATKDTAVVVDGREIAKAVNKVNKIDERRNARVKGLTT